MRTCVIAYFSAGLALSPFASAQPSPSGAECAVTTTAPEDEVGPGIGHFPTDGTVNVLIVFAQGPADDEDHCWDMQDLNSLGHPALVDYALCEGSDPRYESTSDDPTTEWPVLNPS